MTPNIQRIDRLERQLLEVVEILDKMQSQTFGGAGAQAMRVECIGRINNLKSELEQQRVGHSQNSFRDHDRNGFDAGYGDSG